MVRILDTCSTSYPWVARFDIASYYESMRHDILLSMLNEHKVDDELRETVDEYLRLPDHENRGVGMVAGGAISPLLGALYLDPLDKAMQRLEIRGKIIYRRFMDDFVILAKTRFGLRQAIQIMHEVLAKLRLTVHQTKRFIGKAERGFDILGYRIEPGRKLVPSHTSLQRLQERTRRLYEQGASSTRLREYVARWHRWLRGGVDDLLDLSYFESKLITNVTLQTFV